MECFCQIIVNSSIDYLPGWRHLSLLLFLHGTREKGIIYRKGRLTMIIKNIPRSLYDEVIELHQNIHTLFFAAKSISCAECVKYKNSSKNLFTTFWHLVPLYLSLKLLLLLKIHEMWYYIVNIVCRWCGNSFFGTYGVCVLRCIQSLRCPKMKHFNFPNLCSCNSISLVWMHTHSFVYTKKWWNFISNKKNWNANIFFFWSEKRKITHRMNEWRDKPEVKKIWMAKKIHTYP